MGAPSLAAPRPRPVARLTVLLISLFLLLLPLLARAAAPPPAIATTRFAALPAKLSYFPDASVVLYHDAQHGNVYRSPDEGKTWKVLSGPNTPKNGEAGLLIEHPGEQKTAFILTPGTTHYRTDDRGLTWQLFHTDLPPATHSGTPLEFNLDAKKTDHIIYTGKKCGPWTPWGNAICHDEAYYTTDGFASKPKPLMEFLVHCTWAKATKTIEITPERLNRIYCIAWEDSPTGGAPKQSAKRGVSHIWQDPAHLLSKRGASNERRAAAGSATRLCYSDDFFKTRKLVSMDLGRDAKNFVGLGPSGAFLVTALRDSSSGAQSEMAMFVTRDGDAWYKAKFPHGAGLKEGSYTVVEGTAHSLVVDVLDAELGTGRLFTSDSEGSHFVQSLENTNRNDRGIVDYEHLQNVEGAALANTKERGMGDDVLIKTHITWSDGSRWSTLKPPPGLCKLKDQSKCSLHLYSVSKLHNSGRVFSSTAPGFVMGVGSVGDRLLPYDECDTFLSTDAGRNWVKVANDAHKYEFGDSGSILVRVDDEDMTDHISYSWDFGQTWTHLPLNIKIRAKLLTTIPDSTSQKFLLIGSQTRKQAGKQAHHIAVFIDFAVQKKRKCDKDADMEKWYAGGLESSCMMGHHQWFRRRRANADCSVGDKFHDPEPQMDDCPCSDADFECDFNYVKDPNGACVASVPEHIPPGECVGSRKVYQGKSGYRKIPGNTCKGGKQKDLPVQKPCGTVAPDKGEVLLRKYEFPGQVLDHAWFADSSNVLVQIDDGTVWQSLNDGYSWSEPALVHDDNDPDQRFLTLAMHTYDKTRAYLITAGLRVHYTYDSGRKWHFFTAPLQANGLGIGILEFHPERSDWLIWIGSRDCTASTSTSCHTEAWVSTDQGRKWNKIDSYVRRCAWARDTHFVKPETSAIICESYLNKKGNQKAFDGSNPVQLVWGGNYYTKKTVLFPSVVGFAVFEEFLIVAELVPKTSAVALKISLDGRTFALAQFPPNTKIDNARAYTVLDSVTNAVFLHVTTHDDVKAPWGALFKSNSNGTYFALSQDFVNRNEAGFVDFEKMLGLDGIALVNVVSNPDDASVTGKKQLQTRITHNDGGRWKSLVPPRVDVNGAPYECNQVGCNLHLHGYTERDDPGALFSSPTAVGIMLGVGNVGKALKPYADSDTFITRDGGFTWDEVHKDAHRWEFGDQGSIILLVNDEKPTDAILYSVDEGKSFATFNFGSAVRVSNILTVPEDTHRKFILLGKAASGKSVAIHLDFSALQQRKCVLNPQRPEQDDFELFSPSEDRQETCLFGRQTYYYRRKAKADCYVGETLVQPHKVGKNCTCSPADFECEFNHYLDPEWTGVGVPRCLQYANTERLPAHVESQCLADGRQDYWYDRTSVRKVPYSTCDGGARPDRGKRHSCPASLKGHGFFWWTTILLSPFALAALVGIWWQRKSRRRGVGAIRLPDPNDYFDSKLVETIASVPAYVVGLTQMAFVYVIDFAESVPFLRRQLQRNRGYGGYRTLSTEQDAEVLGTYRETEDDYREDE